MQSLKLNCSGVGNLKQKFESWDDTLYKNDAAIAGTNDNLVVVQSGTTPFAVFAVNVPSKRQLTAAEQEFCINLADLSLYVRSKPLWNSSKYGMVKIVLQFDKDLNIFAATDQVTDNASAAVLICTELKIC